MAILYHRETIQKGMLFLILRQATFLNSLNKRLYEVLQKKQHFFFFMIVVYHKALLMATLSVLISHENFKSDHPVQLYMKEEAYLKHCKGDAVVQYAVYLKVT